MKPELHSRHSHRHLLGRVAILACLALASCSGGGEIAGVDSGGTGSFAIGSVSGFGSVIVNGIRYRDHDAAVVDADGSARTTQDLRLGMVVEVEGSALAPASPGSFYAREGEARRVRLGATIVGPLSAVDIDSSRITLLGQTVDLPRGTVYGDELVGGLVALAALPRGAILQIHGYPDPAGGRYAATRVDLLGGATEFLLRGAVRDLDPVNRTFSIGAARIDYRGLAVGEALAAGIVEGALTRVRLGVEPRDDGAWTMLQPASAPAPIADRDEVGIEGVVTALSTLSAFEVNGIPVDASLARIDPAGGRLVIGDRVEVEGQIRRGVLIAAAIRLPVETPSQGLLGRPDGQSTGRAIFLSGTVAAFDAGSLQFRVRGVRVNLSGAHLSFGMLADLRNGITVEVDGRLSDDGASIDAIEIRFVARRTDVVAPDGSDGRREQDDRAGR